MQKFNDYDTVIFTKNNRYPKDTQFGTYFADKMEFIAQSKISLNALRLLLLLLSQLPKKEFNKGNNTIGLIAGRHYEDILGIKRPHIVTAFKKLEDAGLIKRDKNTRSLEIIINPQIAYAGKISKYENTHNQLALNFGYEEINDRKKTKAIMDKNYPSENIYAED